MFGFCNLNKGLYIKYVGEGGGAEGFCGSHEVF